MACVVTKRRIIITGGLGFIGSHTCVQLVQSGYECILVDCCSNSSPDVLARIHRIIGAELASFVTHHDVSDVLTTHLVQSQVGHRNRNTVPICFQMASSMFICLILLLSCIG